MSPTSPSRHRRHRLYRRLSSERPCMPTFVTGVARVSRRLGVELFDQIRDVWFRVVSNRRLGFEFWSLLPVVGHAGIVILLSGRRQEGHPQQGHELQGRQSGGWQGRQGSVRLSHDCGVSSSTRSEMFGFEFYPTGGLVSSFGVSCQSWACRHSYTFIRAPARRASATRTRTARTAKRRAARAARLCQTSND